MADLWPWAVLIGSWSAFYWLGYASAWVGAKTWRIKRAIARLNATKRERTAV